MTLTPLPPAEAILFARRHAPVILQRLTIRDDNTPDPRDLIQRIYTGPFDESIPACAYYAVKRKTGEFTIPADKTDTLKDHWHFVQMGPSYIALYFHFFSRHDWSEGQFGGPIRDALDRHDGDFEGYVTLYRNHTPEWTLTRSHKVFNVYRHETPFEPIIVRETMGHGLSATAKGVTKWPFHPIMPSEYELKPILDAGPLDGISIFKSVDLPWQLRDQRIKDDPRTSDIYDPNADCLYWRDPLLLVDALVEKLNVRVEKI